MHSQDITTGAGPLSIRASISLRSRLSVEWPSIVLSVFVYGGFAAVTGFYAYLPTALFVVAGALVLTLHSSMQHEFIHGHPTPWRRVNRLMGFVPLSLWLPFECYRRSHLAHHRDEALTDPFDDPESYYWTIEGWRQLGPVGRLFIRVHSTLLGRLVLGPAWTMGKFLTLQLGAMARGDRVILRIWAGHGLGVAAVLIWVTGICGIDPLVYLAAMVYPGTSVLLLRSYAEHRAEAAVFERTALVENAPMFGFLFLYNNLHAVHHDCPRLPWYEIPAWYRANRAELVRRNGGLVYDGYGDVMRRYLLRPHHVAVHPLRAGMLVPAQRRESGSVTPDAVVERQHLAA